MNTSIVVLGHKDYVLHDVVRGQRALVDLGGITIGGVVDTCEIEDDDMVLVQVQIADAKGVFEDVGDLAHQLPFAQRLDGTLASLRAMLLEKNRKYGDSALNPVRILSRASTEEQIRVRIDDKLSRLARGDIATEDEDVVQDLAGYLVLLLMAREQGKREKSSEPEER